MDHHMGRDRAKFLGRRPRAFGLALAAILACALGRPALAQNLVQDPGFESTPTGGATSPDWSLDTSSGTTYVNGEGTANSGVWAVEFAATGAAAASQGTLSQTITTAPSTYYTVSFFLANEGGPHNTFLATFGGQTVLSLTDAIENALPGLGRSGAFDVLLASYSLAAPMWQMANPPKRLADEYAKRTDVPPDWKIDFTAALTRLITATCVGLLAESDQD